MPLQQHANFPSSDKKDFPERGKSAAALPRRLAGSQPGRHLSLDYYLLVCCHFIFPWRKTKICLSYLKYALITEHCLGLERKKKHT